MTLKVIPLSSGSYYFFTTDFMNATILLKQKYSEQYKKKITNSNKQTTFSLLTQSLILRLADLTPVQTVQVRLLYSIDCNDIGNIKK